MDKRFDFSDSGGVMLDGKQVGFWKFDFEDDRLEALVYGRIFAHEGHNKEEFADVLSERFFRFNGACTPIVGRINIAQIIEYAYDTDVFKWMFNVIRNYRDIIDKLGESSSRIHVNKYVYWKYIKPFVVWPVEQKAKEEAMLEIFELIVKTSLFYNR
jgi:hypothetical protein